MIPAEMSDNASVQRIGILADSFAMRAGLTDLIVGWVDGLVRTADGREIILVYRTRPPFWSWRSLARRAKAWLNGKPPQLVQDWSALHQRLQAAGLADLPVLTAPGDEGALARMCRREGIDVIGPFMNPPFGGFQVPWLGYIFDFQHRYFPGYFTSQERAGRDAQFRRTLHKADAVVVNSIDVRRDCAKIFPDLPQRVVALPFSAAPKAEWLKTDPATACARYGLGERYFLVSNQFWLHKRHEVAIEAFSALARDEAALELVLTGATDDPRSPTRLDDIRALIRRLGLTGRVHILGLLPKLDQIAIMRGAIAVVQPTAFEGGPGGGAVFDAVALGVPTLVSEIPINLEISSHVTRYFRFDDVAALADVMREMLVFERDTPDAELLIAAGAQRREAMGRAVWQAAELALEHARAVRRVRA